jgi:hypothetical protein
VDSIVINDVGDVGRLDESWTALRRSGATVEVSAPALTAKQRTDLQDRLNAALTDCGCDQGALGVATFSIAATLAQVLSRRSRSGRSSSIVGGIGGGASRVIVAAMGGAVVGKAIGLAAASHRFGRHRQRLNTLLESSPVREG